MNHRRKLDEKRYVYTNLDILIRCKGLDYTQRTDLLKVKKSLYHQVKQLDKLVKNNI